MFKAFGNELIKELSNLSDKLMRYCNEDFNESQTKQSFILPFLEILGYPIYDVDTCQLEVSVLDNRSNTNKHLDYLLRTAYEQEIIIEAKALKCRNLERGKEQLIDYLQISSHDLGIVTNGDLYEVYYKNCHAEIKCMAKFSLKNLCERDLPILTCISYDCRLFADKNISPFDIIRSICLDLKPLDIYVLKIVYNPLLCYQASLNVSIHNLIDYGVSTDGLFSMLEKGFLDVINNVVYLNYQHEIFESLSDEEFYMLFGFCRTEECPENQINNTYFFPSCESKNNTYLFTEKNLENIYISAKESRERRFFSQKFLRDFIDDDVFKRCCDIGFFLSNKERNAYFSIDLKMFNFNNRSDFKRFYDSLRREKSKELKGNYEENLLFDDSVFVKHLASMNSDSIRVVS